MRPEERKGRSMTSSGFLRLHLPRLPPSSSEAGKPTGLKTSPRSDVLTRFTATPAPTSEQEERDLWQQEGEKMVVESDSSKSLSPSMPSSEAGRNPPSFFSLPAFSYPLPSREYGLELYVEESAQADLLGSFSSIRTSSFPFLHDPHRMSDSAPSPPPAEAPVSAGGPSGFLKVRRRSSGSPVES